MTALPQRYEDRWRALVAIPVAAAIRLLLPEILIRRLDKS